VDSRFVRYQLEAAGAALESKGRGSTFTEISTQALAEFPVALPEFNMQRRVADMLDRETASIDDLIAKNENVQLLLTSRWQSSLEQRIFVELEAERCPLWLICDITPGNAFATEDFLHGGGPVRLLRGINVGVGRVDWSETVYTSTKTADSVPSFRLEAGDIVLGMDRPWISGGLRVARIGPQDLPASLVQRVARLRPRDGLDPDYLYLALQSRRFFSTFEPAMTGVSVPHVSGGQIGDFRVPLPDAETQKAVVAALHMARAEISRLKHLVQHQTDLLRTRRQALITAAVTGRIDV
jgi:type I restriction enzyme S subunit